MFRLSRSGRGTHRASTNPISDQVIDAAIEVHRQLGPGLLLLPIHSAQLLTYMRLQRLSAGLLINFTVHTLLHGLRRILH